MRVVELVVAGFFVVVTCFLVYGLAGDGRCKPSPDVYNCPSRRPGANECGAMGNGSPQVGCPEGSVMMTASADGCHQVMCKCELIHKPDDTSFAAWVCPV